MPDSARQYFDNLNPTQPGVAALTKVSVAWTRLQKTVAITSPAALDRCRVWRNRFDSAVS
jgi:hypothetical protein